jgi:hypothetical protein
MYGQAGGTSQFGQPFSRFQLAGDPSPYYPLMPGSMDIVKPAHVLGQTGAAYRYGATKVGGLANMVIVDGHAYPIINSQNQWSGGTSMELLLGGTGGGNYDAIVNGRHSEIFVVSDSNSIRNAGIFVNGEVCAQDTTTASAHYGAWMENFTASGTGVSVNIGSNAVTGVGGTTWTTDVLSGAYVATYAPQGAALNVIRVGDVLEIINAGVSQFYRITAIGSNTSFTIFPVYNGASNATNQPYKVWRTGYGSNSRLQILNLSNVGSSAWWAFYAGNTTQQAIVSGQATGIGTIEAVNLSATQNHYMCPTVTGSTTIFPQAVDVIYYHGFLLYGGGQVIGWSVAGFPTGSGVATIFGAGDFPALNVSTRLGAGFFLGFEQVGEQVLAIFTDSIWIVQATGTVPEFNFFQLPEYIGGLMMGVSDPQLGGAFQSYSRGMCSGRGSSYVISPQGMISMRNLYGQPDSIPVTTYDWPGADNNFELSYDPATDAVLWRDCQGSRGVLLKEDSRTWSVVDQSSLGAIKGMAGKFFPDALAKRPWRMPALGYWQGSTKKITGVGFQPPELETATASAVPWTWATPIVSQGEIYPGFALGGIRPICRAASGQNPTFTIQIYAGNSPFNMQTWGPVITASYQYGVPSARYSLSGGKCDSAYIGFVLSGSSWIQLAGLALYSAETQPGR